MMDARACMYFVKYMEVDVFGSISEFKYCFEEIEHIRMVVDICMELLVEFLPHMAKNAKNSIFQVKNSLSQLLSPFPGEILKNNRYFF